MAGPKTTRPLLHPVPLAILLSACNMGLQTPLTPTPLPPTSPSTADGYCANVYYPVVEGASKSFAGSTIVGEYTEVNTITDVGLRVF